MGNKSIIYNIIDSFMHLDNPSGTVMDFFRGWLIDGGCKKEKTEALEEQWSRMNMMLESIDGPEKSYELMQRIMKPSDKKGFYVRRHTAAAVCILFLSAAVCSVYSLCKKEGVDTTCYVTAPDSKGEFVLPDGSHVWMNSGSRIEFSEDFNVGDERRVAVFGEAFFDVVKGRRPFVVSLGDDISVKVHGTRFNVRNAEIFESVQIALQSGEIEIFNDSNRTMLVPGCCYTCNPSLGTYSISHVNTANFSNWTKSAVIFKDETFGDVITTLEHWYNVKITVENGIDTTLSLSFTLKKEPMEDTFSLLQTLTKYRCTVVDDDHVVISK